MKTIFVDDEKIALMLLEHETEDIKDIEVVGSFDDPSDAVAFCKENPVDLAILDIEMPHMNGMQLGEMLLQMQPNLLLIYVTSYDDHALEAYKLHAAGYILKPYKKEELSYAIESAKLLSKRGNKRIFVRTFGHFDVFIDDQPVIFKSAKAKELLAYLVHREGGLVTTDQIISVLWEDRPNDEATQSLCSKIVKTLEKELAEYQIAHILVTARGIRYVDTHAFECDLYHMLKYGKKGDYIGDYMVDYDWAEERNAMFYGEF